MQHSHRFQRLQNSKRRRTTAWLEPTITRRSQSPQTSFLPSPLIDAQKLPSHYEESLSSASIQSASQAIPNAQVHSQPTAVNCNVQDIETKIQLTLEEQEHEEQHSPYFGRTPSPMGSDKNAQILPSSNNDLNVTCLPEVNDLALYDDDDVFQEEHHLGISLLPMAGEQTSNIRTTANASSRVIPFPSLLPMIQNHQTRASSFSARQGCRHSAAFDTVHEFRCHIQLHDKQPQDCLVNIDALLKRFLAASHLLFPKRPPSRAADNSNIKNVREVNDLPLSDSNMNSSHSAVVSKQRQLLQALGLVKSTGEKSENTLGGSDASMGSPCHTWNSSTGDCYDGGCYGYSIENDDTMIV